ncbi:hypothetical protein HDR60_00870 [bacterium]|nr:hypothetical protein [bacterium]
MSISYVLQTQHKTFNANFHTGKIVYGENKEFNWIYDCGKSNLVRQYLKEVDKVDLIFISHFDRDHINGLPILLADPKAENAQIVVPYLTDEDIAILFSGNFYSSIKQKERQDAFYKFMNELLEIQSQEKFEKEFVYDLSKDDEKSDKNDKECNGQKIIPIVGNNCGFAMEVKFPNDEIWAFKTHVFEDSKLRKSMQNLLKGSTLKKELRDNFNEFKEKFKKEYKKEIQKIKKELGGESRNVMTMSMISMPEKIIYCHIDCAPLAWLHTGDAYLSDINIWKQFLAFLIPYRWRINVCVLPHHASVKSENKKLYRMLDEMCNYIVTPSSRVSFSYPSVRNLFFVNWLSFETIYKPDYFIYSHFIF